MGIRLRTGAKNAGNCDSLRGASKREKLHISSEIRSFLPLRLYNYSAFRVHLKAEYGDYSSSFNSVSLPGRFRLTPSSNRLPWPLEGLVLPVSSPWPNRQWPGPQAHRCRRQPGQSRPIPYSIQLNSDITRRVVWDHHQDARRKDLAVFGFINRTAGHSAVLAP
jgi:hypothetical protein